jgi:PilZ domain
MKSLQQPAYARRLSSRASTRDEVWVYWRCNGRDEVSRVRDLSTKGLFLETEEPRAVGATIRLDFLVQEGQIRANATVQHAESGAGLGLKFMAVTPEDGTHLTALLTRLRDIGSIPLKPVIKELTVLENAWAAQSSFSTGEMSAD